LPQALKVSFGGGTVWDLELQVGRIGVLKQLLFILLFTLFMTVQWDFNRRHDDMFLKLGSFSLGAES